jgi:hypothetical protein
VRVEVAPIHGAEAKLLWNQIEERWIDNRWIESRDGLRFYGAIPFAKLIFKHPIVGFIKKV